MRGFALLLALWLGAPAPAPEPNTPSRWAVIIGVSEYQHFGDEIGGDLPGAANDAVLMRTVLVERWGVPAENVRLLLNSDATRAGIVHALTVWLPEVVQPDDLVLFYFAGHGSQAWDLDGDEEDGLDETIAPHDALRGSTENDIIDDELGAWLRALPTANVVAILDNCHAGTGTREVTPFSRPRTLNRDIATLPQPDGFRGTPGRGAAAAKTRVFFDDDILEIAAAQSDEVAVEIAWPQEQGGRVWGGAFTTLLVRHLWEVAPGTSYAEVFHLTREELRRQGFAQQPRLSSAAVADFPLLAFAADTDALATTERIHGVHRVAATIDASAVEFAGGAAAGFDIGAILDAEGTLLRVTGLHSDRARAEVIAADHGGRVAVGTTARLLAVPEPRTVLRVSIVDLATSTRAVLSSAFAGSHAVAFPEEGDAVDLIIRPAPGGYIVIGIDGATRHELGGGDAAATAALVAALGREAEARQLAVLDNRARPFDLTLALGSGRAALRVGDAVEFRARAREDGYLTIVDLGTDGTLTLLYPDDGDADGRVRAGQLVTLPTPAMRAAGIRYEAQPPLGTGMVRAFLTEQPLALQPADGGSLRAHHVLAALRAVAGVAPGNDERLLPLTRWATAALVYEIAR